MSMKLNRLLKEQSNNLSTVWCQLVPLLHILATLTRTMVYINVYTNTMHTYCICFMFVI